MCLCAAVLNCLSGAVLVFHRLCSLKHNNAVFKSTQNRVSIIGDSYVVRQNEFHVKLLCSFLFILEWSEAPVLQVCHCYLHESLIMTGTTSVQNCFHALGKVVVTA